MSPTASPLRLLVVDDDPDIRSSTRALLGLLGHDACDAVSGKAALDVAAGWAPRRGPDRIAAAGHGRLRAGRTAAVAVLGPAAHVLLLETTDALVDGGFDFASRFERRFKFVRLPRRSRLPTDSQPGRPSILHGGLPSGPVDGISFQLVPSTTTSSTPADGIARRRLSTLAWRSSDASSRTLKWIPRWSACRGVRLDTGSLPAIRSASA
jgi:CheY-like chemotaxis protein